VLLIVRGQLRNKHKKRIHSEYTSFQIFLDVVLSNPSQRIGLLFHCYSKCVAQNSSNHTNWVEIKFACILLNGQSIWKEIQILDFDWRTLNRYVAITCTMRRSRHLTTSVRGSRKVHIVMAYFVPPPSPRRTKPCYFIRKRSDDQFVRLPR